MYTKIYLTNPSCTPLALVNEQFDDEFLLKEDIYECITAIEAERAINSHKPLNRFSIFRDSTKKTIFANKDRLGNIHYLVCEK